MQSRLEGLTPSPALIGQSKSMSTQIRLFWAVLGGVSIAFHLGLIFSGLVPNLISRPLHMALALPWALVFIAKTPVQRISGIVLTLAGGAATLWIAFNQSALSDQYGFLSGDFQFGLAVILLVTVLEMARRSIGWPLPMVAALALAYGLFGQHIPGEFGHPGTPLNSFLGTLTIAEGGLWGSLTAVSVNIVAIFVIFGAVLNAGEAGQGFMNVAAAAAGRLKGGAAKVSVADGSRSLCHGGADRHALHRHYGSGAVACAAVFHCGLGRN
mgnify:CR=1 FL=1